MYKSISLVILLFLTSTINLHSQDHQPSVEFVQFFNTLQSELPRERIFLHTDRQWYIFGDRIWFSAYVTGGSRLLPSGISSVLYVELIEPDGTLAERIAVEIESGRSQGSLTFNNSRLEEGTFLIRAYTAWSKNFGESYEFRSKINVIRSDNAPEIARDEAAPDVQFLPEGGHLVHGIPSRLAFKAIGPNGYGTDVSGTIYDENSSFQAQFRTTHLGMGVIENFVPDINASYVAEINNHRYPLPEVLPQGLVLSLDQNPDEYIINIQSQGVDTGDALLLFAHVRGEVYYASLVLIENNAGTTVIPKESFPTGVVHFTLLGKDGNPAAERLALNLNPLQEINTELKTERESYSLRDEVQLNISLRDADGDNLAANASISVFDDEITGFKPAYSSIITGLLMESDLKGYVEDPGFYFSGTEESAAAADLLMLTQGWRAYDMPEIASMEEISLFSLPEQGFTISGTVLSGFRGRPLEDASVVFSLGSGHEDLEVITTDEQGRFMLTDLQINGSQLITLRANDSRGRDRLRIELDDQFSNLKPMEDDFPQLEFTFEEDHTFTTSEIDERAIQVQIDTERFVDAQMIGELDEIVVTAEREQEADRFERDLRAGERPSQRLDFDEQPHMADIPFIQALNQMSGVSIVGNSLTINTGFTNIGGASIPPPLILIDDIEAELTDLRMLSSLDVQAVNVFRRSSELGFFGVRGAGGVLSIRTRRGDGGSQDNQRGLITANVRGFAPASQFYAPRYGITVPRDIEQQDSRITLFWDPMLDISENGGTVRFWTNDVPSTYRIVVQGITETGSPFFETHLIRVDR
jgi:hypothetical protein